MYGVGLRVFQGNEENHQISLGRIRRIPALSDNVLQKVPIDPQVVMLLFRGDTECLLALQGLWLIIRIDLDNIAVTVFPGLKDL